MKELKNLFIRSIILIFIILTVGVGFQSPTIKTVKASDFSEWSFSLDNKTHQVEISDGDNYLGQGSTKTKGDAWNLFLNRYKVFIVGLSGFATLTIVLIAVFLFTKVSAEGTNPQARSQTIKWIGAMLIAAGLLGAVTMIFSYSYNVFR